MRLGNGALAGEKSEKENRENEKEADKEFNQGLSIFRSAFHFPFPFSIVPEHDA